MEKSVNSNKILFFGITKDITGLSELYLNLEGKSIATFKEELTLKFPKLKLLSSLNIALNHEYVPLDLIISLGDEIALIPPVSGG